MAICMEFEENCVPTGCEFCRLAGLDWVRENKVEILLKEDYDVLISAG